MSQKSFQEIHHADSAGWESSKAPRSHLRHLEAELSFLSMLTGFNITHYSKKTEDPTSAEMTEESIKKVLQRHRLSGSCHVVMFQLEFQILEIQNKENLSSVITDLSIVMEPTEYSELNEFVSSFPLACPSAMVLLTCNSPKEMEPADHGLKPLKPAEERRDLFMFFRGLHFFVEWYEYRKRTFKHFKDKYPDVVHLPEGPCSRCMGIHSASCPGFELMIVWRIQIDEEGKVSPLLDLLTKIPQRALELDKNRVIETAPLCFRTLLRVLGIEAAVESLIRLLQTGNA
ncbi:centromere protein P isoform X2 [Fukomys damarensis]|uniref:centromere protein P isoform X2 n=1 Tax=Fukomys damarensis TaxID=885580 RepID=UPI00053FE2B4|nr:centromere protein P isoform X2 [Fukomys damarensis]